MIENLIENIIKIEPKDDKNFLLLQEILSIKSPMKFNIDDDKIIELIEEMILEDVNYNKISKIVVNIENIESIKNNIKEFI